MRNKVLASFEDSFGSQCIDIFTRENGTFGFEEFRGESDGAGRWQSLSIRLSQDLEHSPVLATTLLRWAQSCA